MSNRLGTAALAVAGARLSAGTATHAVGGILAGGVAALFRRIRDAHRRRQTERALYALSDIMLRDIGIHRFEIRAVTGVLIAGGKVNPRASH